MQESSLQHPQAKDAAETGQRADIWTRYWSSGALHSCSGSHGDPYGGEIASFWARQFVALSADDHVLEIGTGNGALPRLMLEQFNPQRPPEMDAVDLAFIEPAWLREIEPERAVCVRFHGGVRAESLPFADPKFSLAVSQFALEYTDIEPAIAEISRCCLNAARVALVMHRSDSTIAQVSETELRHIEWLLREDGLYRLAASLLPYVGRLAEPGGAERLRADPDANRLRQAYNQEQRALEARALELGTPDVLNLAAQGVAYALSLAPAGKLIDAQTLLSRQSQALQDSAWRLVDLREHALDEARLNQVEQMFLAQGFARIEQGTVSESGQMIGWTLVLQRHNRVAA